ncbi:C2H2 type zinc-finger-domain-containing protein [Thelonectria olida]|uniref:C2H2 type zinc-finger-domain-containing protein n=1 Tax=Thelonectria olida TaxID=1576542 RepID=A0A9P8W4I7_9HYPO|nr:C2H2 type zinc-finger-domain-containing protein [Thelonectria olida]
MTPLTTPPTATPTAPPPGLSCSICHVSFDTAQEQRRHAKSESHVENLRKRVVASGLSTLPTPDNCRDSAQASGQSSPSDTDPEDNVSENEATEFQSEDCLFCPNSSTTFDENLSHMKTTHGLTIPYRDNLAVEPATLIWYLHLVIFAYHECISCGTRRRTVEGVQQHMLDKGHCRFEISDETMEFYDLEGIKGHATGSLVRPDEDSLRLPSGSVISHRNQTSSSKPRPPNRRTTSGQDQGALLSHASSDALTTKDRKDTALASQLSRLSVKDQQSLIHLPDSAQRSFLVQRKKEIDVARRKERRVQRMAERLRVGHEIPGTHAKGTHGGPIGATIGR